MQISLEAVFQLVIRTGVKFENGNRPLGFAIINAIIRKKTTNMSLQRKTDVGRSDEYVGIMPS